MERKKIGMAADHGGYNLRKWLTQKLQEEGYEIVDYGNTVLDTQDDYPDFVIPMATDIGNGTLSRGIAVCGSGVGACIAANKISGVRACLITDTFSAHQGVEDDDMNLICLGGRITGSYLAVELVKSFLDAEFSGLERHNRRLSKIKSLE
ncbi:MAG TPA: RpiB/LacA/LacB family sugar-phosphate isomerase [Bacteroidales bacterium]|nr:RpiB/LacA/LacB family sugar-phosphate isomerase [Bacteroidales bacterium]